MNNTVYVVFNTGNEDYYSIERFVDVFSTSEKAQAYIDSVIHQRRLDCKRRQLVHAFTQAWAESHPVPYEDIQQTRPKYDHRLQGDKEYNQQHEARIHEWREKVERPYSDRMFKHLKAESAALAEYMETIDLKSQDLSDVDLAYYEQENDLLIKPIEVK